MRRVSGWLLNHAGGLLLQPQQQAAGAAAAAAPHLQLSTCTASLQPSTSQAQQMEAVVSPSPAPRGPRLRRQLLQEQQEQGDAAAATTRAEFAQRVAAGPNFMDFVQGKELNYSVEAPSWKDKVRKPDWMKRPGVPGGEKYLAIKEKLRSLKLHTVCEEAKCPNMGECWGGDKDGHGATATIMLMGDTCTRGCKFCAVKTSRAPPPLDPEEPAKVASAIAAWGVDYIVLTSVDRDDLPDHGAAHIAATIALLKEKTGGKLLVEALVPDFLGKVEGVQAVVAAGLDVFAHNVETVPRLQGAVRDRRANWAQSLSVLRAAKEAGVRMTKTSIMLGCGETREEVIDAFQQLRAAGVDVVTLGQYMRPTKKHMAVSEYITPEAFEAYARIAESMGFAYTASGPMVRSSYRAGEFYLSNLLKRGQAQEGGQGQGQQQPERGQGAPAAVATAMSA